MTWGGVKDLPSHSTGPRRSLDAIYRATRDAGYEAMQGGAPELCQAHGLQLLGDGVVPTEADAERFVASWKGKGAACATCIVGYGYESDSEIDLLVGALDELSTSYGLPVYVETHRASVTQDAWRTVQLANRIPNVRFNGDFSHWFTGQEMLYGDFSIRLSRLQPIFERVRFLHGRIGSRCCMQEDIGSGPGQRSIPYFRQFWIRVMQGFMHADDSGTDLWFCPELLGPEYGYAPIHRTPNGDYSESSDRWAQAKALVEIATSCFDEAARLIHAECSPQKVS